MARWHLISKSSLKFFFFSLSICKQTNLLVIYVLILVQIQPLLPSQMNFEIQLLLNFKHESKSNEWILLHLGDKLNYCNKSKVGDMFHWWEVCCGTSWMTSSLHHISMKLGVEIERNCTNWKESTCVDDFYFQMK